MTKKIFIDLAILMIGFGIIIGIVFPFFMKLLGVNREIAYSPLFFIACIVAGIIVGVVNIILSRVIIVKKFRLLIQRMHTVRDNLIKISRGGNLNECTPEKCHITIDSNDEIGDTARTFNNLVDTLFVSLSSEKTMQEYSKILTSNLELSSLSKNALSLIIEASGSDAGIILTEREGELLPVGARGIKNPEKLSHHPIIQDVLRNNKQKITTIPKDISIDGLLVNFRPNSIICEPLVFNNIPIGVLVLASMSSYNEDSISKIRNFSQNLSLALFNAITHENMEKLATIDPLTSLLNRRYGMIRLREEYSKAIRSKSPLGVIMFDIDNFKKVNDTYGHLAGDKVLVNISRITRPILREGDIFMRYGGEEFCIILPGASAEDSFTMSERIRFVVDDSKVIYAGSEIKVTLSLGVASYPESEIRQETDLISYADKALYISKKSGRNKSNIFI